MLARKGMIMMSGLFNTSHPERGWYMGSMIIIGSLVLQAFARPYKDKLIDLCETISLLSTLIIFQAGMVWSMNEEVRSVLTSPVALLISGIVWHH